MLNEILNIPVNNELTAKAPRVNKLTLLKNNIDLKETTDDKTPEEKAAVEELKAAKQREGMEIERPQGRITRTRITKRNEDVMDSQHQVDDVVAEEAEESPMEVKVKSRRRRKKKAKDTEMDVMEENK